MSPAVILHPLFAAAPPLFPGLTSLCCLITSLPPHISFLISHRCLSHATRVFLDKRLLLQWEGKGLRLRGQRKNCQKCCFVASIFEQFPPGLDSFYSFMGRLVRFRWTNRFSPSDCLTSLLCAITAGHLVPAGSWSSVGFRGRLTIL